MLIDLICKTQLVIYLLLYYINAEGLIFVRNFSQAARNLLGIFIFFKNLGIIPKFQEFKKRNSRNFEKKEFQELFRILKISAIIPEF
jgi:hypothetical protein